MKRIDTALLALLAAWWLSEPALADPLHKIGVDGAWVHANSGWVFPRSVADFERVAQPYNIDGNDDAGAEYRRGAVVTEVEVYVADSAAPSATLDGAKVAAARKAGETARAQSEKPFQVGGLKDATSVKVTYAAKKDSADARTILYYVMTDRWRVKVLINTPARDKAADERLHAFVQALPWSSLGTDAGLH